MNQPKGGHFLGYTYIYKINIPCAFQFIMSNLTKILILTSFRRVRFCYANKLNITYKKI